MTMISFSICNRQTTTLKAKPNSIPTNIKLTYKIKEFAYKVEAILSLYRSIQLSFSSYLFIIGCFNNFMLNFRHFFFFNGYKSYSATLAGRS